MTPPNNYTNGNGTRRVEFSGLSTIDSEAPEESQTHPWDTETDHLLSYFLSDPTNHGGSTPGNSQFQEYSSSRSHSNDTSPPMGMNASYGHDSSRTSSNSTLTELQEPPQPRTPAMQFYHGGSSSHSSSHSQHPVSYARQTAENIASIQAQTQMISSSSSSSLSSMAATLVGGAPIIHHPIHHRHHAPNTTSQQGHGSANDSNAKGNSNQSNDSSPGHGDDHSPISPAAMIGTGHENLMLPPPSRKQSRDRVQAQAAATVAGNAHPQVATTQGTAPPPAQPFPNPQPQMVYHDPNHKEGHLEWLKQLNARAKAASQGGQPAPQPGSMMHPMVGIQPPPPVVSQHPAGLPIPTAGAPPHVFHAGTFPNAAAAAAAVAQNPMLYQAALNHKFHMAAQSQGESEEKRARRLERNRESARKSRRRKKERLATLGAQVERLHTQIEDERRNQVNAMCAALKQVRRDEIGKLVHDVKENPDILNTQAGAERLTIILASSSAGSVIAQKSMAFQYSQLRQLLLPRYQKFLLWLTQHDESFFTAGKDEYTRKDGKQVLRVSSGRVSSKQIGDELTNGWKTEKVDKKKKADAAEIAERSNPTSRALDAARIWPLLCFELSISVDQEERLLQAIKRLQQMENLPNYRSQLAAAIKLTSSLTEAIGTQCQASNAREQRSFLNALTPAQAVKFQEWVAANQERCNRVLRERRPTPETSNPVFKDKALEEFCKRLEEVLRISKRDA